MSHISSCSGPLHITVKQILGVTMKWCHALDGRIVASILRSLYGHNVGIFDGKELKLLCVRRLW